MSPSTSNARPASAGVHPPSPEHPITPVEIARLARTNWRVRQRYIDEETMAALVWELRVADALHTGEAELAQQELASRNPAPPPAPVATSTRAVPPAATVVPRADARPEWARRLGAMAFTETDAAARAPAKSSADRDADVIASSVATYNAYGPPARRRARW